jgi:hypothetical protein
MLFLGSVSGNAANDVASKEQNLHEVVTLLKP